MFELPYIPRPVVIHDLSPNTNTVLLVGATLEISLSVC